METARRARRNGRDRHSSNLRSGADPPRRLAQAWPRPGARASRRGAQRFPARAPSSRSSFAVASQRSRAPPGCAALRPPRAGTHPLTKREQGRGIASDEQRREPGGAARDRQRDRAAFQRAKRLDRVVRGTAGRGAHGAPLPGRGRRRRRGFAPSPPLGRRAREDGVQLRYERPELAPRAMRRRPSGVRRRRASPRRRERGSARRWRAGRARDPCQAPRTAQCTVVSPRGSSPAAAVRRRQLHARAVAGSPRRTRRGRPDCGR